MLARVIVISHSSSSSSLDDLLTSSLGLGVVSAGASASGKHIGTLWRVGILWAPWRLYRAYWAMGDINMTLSDSKRGESSLWDDSNDKPLDTLWHQLKYEGLYRIDS